MRFGPRFLTLLREAKAGGVLVEEVSWARLGQISGGAVHQGIVLQPAAAETLDLPSLIEGCRGIGEPPLLIAVDGLTDPQNLGAIVRSAEALGAHGMVLPQRRNAGLTGSVAKVAAGALEHLPVARVVNLNRSLEALRQEGYRVIGLAAEGNLTLEEADLEGPLVVVTGSEAEGLSLLTRRSCDQLVRIPLRGTTPSLNAGVATALLLYEVARRSWMQGLRGTSPAPRLQRPALPSSPAELPAADTAATELAPAPPAVADSQGDQARGEADAGNEAEAWHQPAALRPADNNAAAEPAASATAISATAISAADLDPADIEPAASLSAAEEAAREPASGAGGSEGSRNPVRRPATTQRNGGTMPAPGYPVGQDFQAPAAGPELGLNMRDSTPGAIASAQPSAPTAAGGDRATADPADLSEGAGPAGPEPSGSASAWQVDLGSAAGQKPAAIDAIDAIDAAAAAAAAPFASDIRL